MNYFPMERNRYFYGKLLSVRDFEIEQSYSMNKRFLTNRLLHGPGVVCGLDVTVDNDSTLIIGSGMALDYEGHEIVIEKPLIRKINMFNGQETLNNAKDCWLCLSYSEKNVEPVSSVSADMTGQEDNRQCNLVREGYFLSVTTEKPDYKTILEARGFENVNVLYHSDELTLVLCMPSCIIAGEDFNISVLVVKNEQTPPVHFNIDGDNIFATTAVNSLILKYNESSEEKRKVYFVEFPQKAHNLGGTKSSLMPNGGEINIELGSHHYRQSLILDAPVTIVNNKEEFEKYYKATDNLEKHLTGTNIPIYLAKMELIYSAGCTFVGSVTSLPLEQRLIEFSDNKSKNNEAPDFTVGASVRSLAYYEKPEVSISYDRNIGKLNFDFAIPSPEQYDFTTSHGVIEIPLPGGNRVNNRYYSEEVSYGLGPGAVDVRLTVEFESEDEDTCLLVGNNDVFNARKDVPKAEAAAILHPEKGTMTVGVWLHDDVKGNSIRIHYFACKPNKDSSVIVAERKVSISINPEMTRVSKGEQVRFKATVTGTENKDVRWSIKESDGGTIDNNGIYTAPQIQGTYEIEVVSLADEDVFANGFVIVE